MSVRDFAAVRREAARWAGGEGAWGPLEAGRRRVAAACEDVAGEPAELAPDRPLLVAMFGGTGTGKSTLANAIAGAEVAVPGRQRPTTRRPTLVVHDSVDPETVLPGGADVDVVRSENTAFLDFALLDCPDPDTDGGPAKAGTDAAASEDDPVAGTNLARLRAMLPSCDVLIVTATQQKYRSARVLDELRGAGSGVRLLFVQTHAGVDDDIRDDWSRHLASVYDVPDAYFVDSVEELRRHRAGEPAGEEFARLLGTLSEELSARSRGTVRLRNRVAALKSALGEARTACDPRRKELGVVREAIDAQQRRVTDEIVGRLRDELRECRGLWEQRLMAAVAERWGASPFSAAMKVYGGLGGILSSFALLRARSTAQLAVAGVLSGARVLRERREKEEREDRWEQAILGGPDESLLEEARLVVADAASRAGLEVDERSETSRVAALSAYEHDLVEATGKRVEAIIDDLAAANARGLVRWPYEIALTAFLGFVVYRIVTNFFWDSFFGPAFTSREPAALLGFDFYLAAAVLLVLWAGLLVGLFARRLRGGLGGHIDRMAADLVGRKLPHSLFPTLREAIGTADTAVDELHRLDREATCLAESLPATRLGGRR